MSVAREGKSGEACGSDAQLTEPVAIFEQGAACFRLGKFGEALARFERAHAMDPDPTLLYNIARSHEGLDDSERAIMFYEKYLETRPDAPDRGAVESRIEQLKRARAEEQPSPRPVRHPSPSPSPSLAPWIIAGIGVAGLGVGSGFAAAASASEDDAVAEPDAFAALELRDQAEKHATIANVAFIAGGAVALFGAVWGAVDLATYDNVEVELAADGLWLSASF